MFYVHSFISKHYTIIATPTEAGAQDLVLDVLYYDFSKEHPDFADLVFPGIDSPTLVSSPYGAWLKVSDTPADDTFSAWYRSNVSVNHEVNDTIILAHQSGSTKK